MRIPIISLLAVTVILTTSSSCSFTGEVSSDTFTIISYNVQTLFDTVDDGDEFEGFSLADGWTGEAYRERLRKISSALIQYTQEPPSIIILQEVENERVVEDLLSQDLAQRGLRYYAATASDASPIEIALISRYEIIESHIHRVEGFRDILEVLINVDGERIRIYALHLRSRRGGAEESEPERIAQIRALKGIMERNSLSGNVLPTVIAGDFNESADQHQLIQGAYQSALIPSDASRRDEWESEGSLVITGGYPSEMVFHTFYLEEHFPQPGDLPGSYHWEGLWKGYDQILLTNDFFDSAGYIYEEGGVLSHPALLNEKGTPWRYSVHTHKGVSDHLPVYVRFRRGY